MKVCFIGVGSIAQRHIRNIKELLGDGVEVSVVRSGRGRPLDGKMTRCVDHVYKNMNEMADGYDAVFITNPTALHYKTLMECYDKSKAFFVEKPVFVTGEEDADLIDGNKVCYVACPLRHTNVIQWLKNNIDFSTVHAMRIISSSYLPEWRPGTDYRDSYSAKRAMGGGVSADLIHEWDYIIHLIGFPNYVHSLIKKKSHLEIDADDIAVYLADYDDKVVEVHLDYFGRKAIRQMELFMTDDTLRADLINHKIEWLRKGMAIDLSEDRDSYQKKELLHFFDVASGKIENDNGVQHACKVLKIARGIGQ